METQHNPRCTAFQNSRCIAAGTLAEVVRKVKPIIDQLDQSPVLIFDDGSSAYIDVDFRGELQDVLGRLDLPRGSAAGTGELERYPAPEVKRGPGRPKLGVTAREITLLPRHWDWLNEQPGGASVTLRKLVEQARRVNCEQDKIRRSKEATYRFISAMAGDLPGYEEATRSLFAGDPERFKQFITSWPADIRNFSCKLAQAAFENFFPGCTRD